jgi:hypothetical protein
LQLVCFLCKNESSGESVSHVQSRQSGVVECT